jgi:hypothetical protein
MTTTIQQLNELAGQSDYAAALRRTAEVVDAHLVRYTDVVAARDCLVKTFRDQAPETELAGMMVDAIAWGRHWEGLKH